MTTAEKVARAIRIPTVSAVPAGVEGEAHLIAFQELLRELFPLVHRTLHRDAPDPYRLVYRWNPADPDAAARRPILLMAHYDVVPADGTGWSVDPFAGEIRDGSVWGRGAIDNKTSVIAIMEAVEQLLAAGLQPGRPIYLAFGGDEELGGPRGAANIARTFRERSVRFALTLDEGGIIARAMVPGVSGPAALVGCGEKASIDVRLAVSSDGGHSSNPLPRDPAYPLVRGLSRILRRRQPIHRTATVTAFIRALGRIMGGLPGAVLRGYPVTAPLVHRFLAATPETDSMIRNTQSVTMLRGSDAPNVLPRTRWANLNMRLLPGQSIDGMLASLRRRTGRFGVAVELAPWSDVDPPPEESPSEGAAFAVLRAAIGETWSDTPVLPYLVTATTDSRHYRAVSDAVYRFLPYVLGRQDLAGVHGLDERISVDNVDSAVRFYRSVITTAGRDLP